MNVLVTILGMALTLGISLGGCPAEGHAAEATLNCPASAQAGQAITLEVAIDVGATTALGAYSVAVTYDAADLTVGTVAGGTTAQFSGTPTANTPTPGTTNVAGFQSADLTLPTGIVSVAKILFTVTGTASPTTVLGLTVKSLFDTDAVAILPATGMGCSVSVTGSTPTGTPTTATTTSTTPTTPTTTTTLPCTTARCTLDAGLSSPACAGEIVPGSVTKKFDVATSLIEQAGSSPAKQAQKILKRARKALKQGRTRATRAARGKKPKLSAECAAALGAAAGDLAATL